MAPPHAGRLALVTGATRGLGRAIAERLRDDGANVIGTGTIADGEVPDGVEHMAVDFTDEAGTEAFAKRIAAREPLILVPIGRMARPAEIAAFASWLVGPENTYISGSNLIIDGGLVRV